MEWFILTLVSVVMYSFIDLLEKRFMITRVKSSIIMVVFLSLFYPLHLIIIVMIGSIEFNIYAIIAVGIGSMMSFAYILFMRSLLIEELSRITILAYIHPILVAILAYIIFKEELDVLDYLALALLLGSSSLISYRKDLKISRALIPMLGLNLAISVEYIVMKYILLLIPYTSYLFWFTFGLIVSRIFLLFNKDIKKRTLSLLTNKNSLYYGITISILFLISNILIVYVTSFKEVSLIASIIASQPLVTLTLIYIVNNVRCNFIDEDLSYTSLIQKIISAIMVVISLYIFASND